MTNASTNFKLSENEVKLGGKRVNGQKCDKTFITFLKGRIFEISFSSKVLQAKSL